MKTLLSTTALALALSLPSVTMAQTTTAPATPPATQGQPMEMPGFLNTREQTDLYVSELIGQEVHARRVPEDMNAARTQSGTASDGTRTMTTIDRAELDQMDNIGQINEIVLSSDGQVRAIVIGVGGFLGAGEQDVAVTMDQVVFAADPEDRTRMYVVVNTGADLLRQSPRYDRRMMTDGRAADGGATTTQRVPGTDRTVLNRPDMTREGYNLVEATQVSAELLVGKSVYGVNDDAVGTVEDLIVDDAGSITEVIIDFGGFLGIGSSQVALGFDELTILSNDGNADVRVYVDATKDQIQSLPKYEAQN